MTHIKNSGAFSSTAENSVSSTWGQVFLWFGAAISIAEILTGTFLAPLGLEMGILAILIGHGIGAVILYLAGLIGAQSGLSASQSSRLSFGRWGSYGFSIANIAQLVGWTAVMIFSGAAALNSITMPALGLDHKNWWCVLIGGLIVVWVMLGVKHIAKINAVVVAALLAACLVLGWVAFQKDPTQVAVMQNPIDFGAAVELNVAMALSWMPLISDYTRGAQKPRLATAVGVAAYILGSSLMFVIGLGAVLYAGTFEVGEMMLRAGLGMVGVGIVVFSTVTTTFLDAWSAGVSAANINEHLNERLAATVVALVGTALAIWGIMENYQNFLYLIGSVFAPLFAVFFVDYYLLGRRQMDETLRLNVLNAGLWLAGFVLYRILIMQTTPVGITLPVMLVTALLTFLVHRLIRKKDHTF